MSFFVSRTHKVIGTKLVNEEIRDENLFRKRSCYIMQDDRLEPLLTISEAMMLAAKLRIPSTYSSKRIPNQVRLISS